MNNLFSNLLKPLNALGGIGIIFYFTILGAYGPAVFLTTIQFFQTLDPSIFESLPSKPSALGAVMGFLWGVIVATFACGLISTILLIKEHLDQIRTTLKSVDRKI
tara:strand:- start:1206 stop:1520 length:315 start_codon:yes stop_codon:yes gene_type:complete